MAFDLNPDQVAEIRSKYQGSTPPIDRLFQTAEYVQNELIEGESALIGGITTIEGIQSTKTRREISASVDLIIDDSDITELGQNYDSWTFGNAYFADINNIEVGVLEIDDFEPYQFPYSSLRNSYEEEIHSHSLNIAEPESNIASKFSRLQSEIKDSDAVDMNSHLHWTYKRQNRSLESLVNTIQETVDRPYDERIERIKQKQHNFEDEEKTKLNEALGQFEDLLVE